MKKIILRLALVLCMVMTMLPATARAEGSPEIPEMYVGNTKVTTESSTPIYWKANGGEGSGAYVNTGTSEDYLFSVVFDSTKGGYTLTLNGVDIETYSNVAACGGIYAGCNLNIVLPDGKMNSIVMPSSIESEDYGINAAGNIDISGKGTLDVTVNSGVLSDNKYGINSRKGITIKDCNVGITKYGQNGDAIAASNDIRILGDAKISVVDWSQSDGAKCGLHTNNGNVAIGDSASVNICSQSKGIYARNNAYLGYVWDEAANGGDGGYVKSGNPTVKINDAVAISAIPPEGENIFTAGRYGIYVRGDIFIAAGKVSATGQQYGINSQKSITISGSDTEVNVSTQGAENDLQYGMFSFLDITIADAKVNVTKHGRYGDAVNGNDIRVLGSAKVNLVDWSQSEGDDCGLHGNGNVAIGGSAAVNICSQSKSIYANENAYIGYVWDEAANDGAGGYVKSGSPTVKINDASAITAITPEVETDFTAGQYGIYSRGDLFIAGGKISATGERGIYSENKGITISGSNTEVNVSTQGDGKDKSYGIRSGQGITITDAKVAVTQTKHYGCAMLAIDSDIRILGTAKVSVIEWSTDIGGIYCSEDVEVPANFAVGDSAQVNVCSQALGIGSSARAYIGYVWYEAANDGAGGYVAKGNPTVKINDAATIEAITPDLVDDFTPGSEGFIGLVSIDMAGGTLEAASKECALASNNTILNTSKILAAKYGNTTVETADLNKIELVKMGAAGTYKYNDHIITYIKIGNLSEITKGAVTNGSYTVKVNGAEVTSALAGDTITLSAAPSNGYSFSSWNIYKTGEPTTKVTVTGNTFTMPAYAVTIEGVFTANPIPNSPSNNGGGHSSTSNASSTATTIVQVNGESQSAGTTANTTNATGQTVTTVTVDTAKLDKVLETKGDKPTVTIPMTGNSNVAIAGLTGQMVKTMETKAATLEVKTSTATYTLPATEISIDSVSKQLGQDVRLDDIKVQIQVAEPPANTVKVVENSAKAGEFKIIVPPVNFEISCTYGGKTVDVSKFNSYVERTIAIPDGVDPTKITTGVVIEPDGTVRHVPTQVIQVNGKYYAKINSLTNSTYTVIWNPIAFSDVKNHWAKDAINNMGSRKVVSGTGNGNYNPNNAITRAEFTAIVVRALGLEIRTGGKQFGDIKTTDWFCNYIETASQYGIINGKSATKFAPTDKITREQAMVMIARAMKITGMEQTLSESEISQILTNYTDAPSLSSYAKSSIASCLKGKVISGMSSNTLAPKNNITRAEVAVIVERLLKKSELI